MQIQKTVQKTIERFDLFDKKDKIAVAVSGGKDSLTVLFLLNELGYDVEGFIVDEGIGNFRLGSIKAAKDFCEKKNLKLRVLSFKESYGYTLDEIIEKTGKRPCTVCGILRRRLLNKISQDYDVLVTGHNMDDESQAVLMNLLKGNIPLLKRQGPVSGLKKRKHFTKRVKPLYFVKESDIIKFSEFLSPDRRECPNREIAFRLSVLGSLNKVEKKIPDVKKNILEWFLRYKENVSKTKKMSFCDMCGSPSTSKICNSCKVLKCL